MNSTARSHLDLPVRGMTCASCAARIERRLNRLDGVSASVNYATELASVAYDPATLPPAALVAAIERAGYHASVPVADRPATDTVEENARDVRRRLVPAIAMSVPVLALAMVPALQFDGWQWLSLLLATPVVLWSGWPFHRAALANLRHATATMDTLVSIGALAAWGWSAYAILILDSGRLDYRMPLEWSFGASAAPAGHLYFEVAVTITTLILLGRYLELRAKRRAGTALRALLAMGAKEAVVVVDGREQRVPIDRVSVGDLLVVRPGERVPTDGEVVQGRSEIDRSLLTGESLPVGVGPGDAVTGATMNAGGRLLVRATAVGADTSLAQIGRMVSAAQSGKASAQRLADRVSAVFVPVVLLLSAATLGLWMGGDAETGFAFEAAVAVLVVACPCALGLATPTALLVGTGRGAQLGILIKGPEALERTRSVTAVVLDKTGTVTEGRMTVISVAPEPGEDRHAVLRLAGAVAQASTHPISQAIAARALTLGAVPAVTESRDVPGVGVEGRVDGHSVTLGRDEEPPTGLEERGSVALVRRNGRPIGRIVLADPIKPTSREGVRQLRDLGLRPVLLTGDNQHIATRVARDVGIEEVASELLPEQKVNEIRQLQGAGEVVAVVGDGINDAPALAQADLGLAIGTGTDVAIEAADLTLISGDLRAVPDAIRLARSTLRTIRGNLAWAFAYNVLLIPVAMAGRLDPMLAAAAMAISSLFVVTNSLRLRRFRSTREETTA